MKHLRNRWLRAVLAIAASLVLVELAWITWGVGYLRSEAFRQALRQGPSQVSFGTLSSVFPTSVELSQVSIVVAQERVRWNLDFERASLSLRILPLFWRQLNVSSLRGQGGKISVETKAKEGDENLPLPSLPAAEVLADKAWSLSIDHLEIEDLASFRVEDLRIVGNADFALSLLLGRDKKVELRNGLFSLERAEVFKGEHRIGSAEDSKLEFKLEGISGTESLEEIAQKLESKLKVDVQLLNIGALYSWLAKVKWLKLEGEGARIQGTLGIKDAAFVAGSQLAISAGPTRATYLNQIVSGTASSTWQVDERGSVLIDLIFDSYELKRVQAKAAEVQGANLSLQLRGEKPKLGQELEQWEAEIKIPTATITNMAFLNAYVPAGTGLSFEAGRGTLEGELKADSQSSQKSGGFLRFQSENIRIFYELDHFAGNLDAALNFASLDLAASSFRLIDSKLSVAKVRSEADRGGEDWWGHIEIPKGHIKLDDAVSFQGSVSLQGKDLRPLLALYSNRSALPTWAIDFLNLKDLKVTFNADADASSLAIDRLEASAENLSMKGWFRMLRKNPRGQLLLHYRGLSGGLKVDGETYGVKLFPAASWLTPAPEKE